MKEDAQQVSDAKAVIEKYAKQVSELEDKIKVLEDKSNKAIYAGETVGQVPNIDPSFFEDKT